MNAIIVIEDVVPKSSQGANECTKNYLFATEELVG
jgi:hypothetical protein